MLLFLFCFLVVAVVVVVVVGFLCGFLLLFLGRGGVGSREGVAGIEIDKNVSRHKKHKSVSMVGLSPKKELSDI